MKRSFTIFLWVCLACCSPKVSAAQPNRLPSLSVVSKTSDTSVTFEPRVRPDKNRVCGPTGLFRVLEIKKIKVILLQWGCYIQRNGKTVGFDPQETEILIPNNEERYMLSFSEGAYFFFRKGRPHLTYFHAGGRHVIQLPNFKAEEYIFNYSQFLRALQSK